MTALRFRKKPVVIEAFQFLGRASIPTWAFHACDPDGRDDAAVIHTLEGDMVAHRGDWIIRGVAGEFYPCKPAIFEATYEVVRTEDE